MADEKQITPDGKVIKKVQKMTGIIRLSARHHEATKNETCMLTGNTKANVDAIVAFREKLKAKGIKYTFTEIFVKLVTEAIKQEMSVNCSREGDTIVYYDSINMGVAVTDPKDNVIVPVIKNIQDMTLPQISAAIKGLAEKVRTGKLTPDDISGGTITVSSMGMFSLDVFNPYMNSPQSCIVGLARIKKEPVVDKDGNITVGNVMNVNVTADHAIIPGSPHARFMTAIVNIFEDPEKYIGPLE